MRRVKGGAGRLFDAGACLFESREDRPHAHDAAMDVEFRAGFGSGEDRFVEEGFTIDDRAERDGARCLRGGFSCARLICFREDRLDVRPG